MRVAAVLGCLVAATMATLYGLTSRLHLHLILPVFWLVLLRPRWMGFRVGATPGHWRMLLVMLVVNCATVGGYLLLAGAATPTEGTSGG